jgi:hypothetical protein
MASSVTDTAKDLGRKLVDRVETVAGDDYREAKKRVSDSARELRSEYRYYTGSGGSKKARKPDPRKYPKSRTASR